MKIDAQSVAKELGISDKHIPLLVNSFLEESKTIMSALNDAIGTGDFASIALNAHSIKGSASNLRILDVQNAALAMEMAGKKQDDSFDYTKELANLQTLIDAVEL